MNRLWVVGVYILGAVSWLLVAGCRLNTRQAPVIPPSAATRPTTVPTSRPTPVVADEIRPGTPLPRRGDEIMVCGQLFHVGTPVVLWTDPGGYDAYRTERRFAPWDRADFDSTQKELPDVFDQPNRYGARRSQVDDATFERIRGGGWDLSTLQTAVDQFVIHYDASGVSRQAFNVLHDRRDLSVHFMLDLDGTIYQTLDVKERAWHATVSNSRSIGIEIANIGAFPTDENGEELSQWYQTDDAGYKYVALPGFLARNSGIRTRDFVGRPIREEPVVRMVQGKEYRMYDFTPQQYASLAKLTAALCTVFPKINCDAPRDEQGAVINHALAADQLRNYQGLLGHFHVQADKQDPGPAFQWDKVIAEAQGLMSDEAKQANRDSLGHPAIPVIAAAPGTAPSTRPATTQAATTRAATTQAPATSQSTATSRSATSQSAATTRTSATTRTAANEE